MARSISDVPADVWPSNFQQQLKNRRCRKLRKHQVDDNEIFVACQVTRAVGWSIQFVLHCTWQKSYVNAPTEKARRRVQALDSPQSPPRSVSWRPHQHRRWPAKTQDLLRAIFLPDCNKALVSSDESQKNLTTLTRKMQCTPESNVPATPRLRLHVELHQHDMQIV